MTKFEKMTNMNESRQQVLESKKVELNKKIKRDNIYIIIEVVVWTIFALVVGWLWYYNKILNAWDSGVKNIGNHEIFNIVVLSTSIVIIPSIFKIVFGSFPFQLLKRKINFNSKDDIESKGLPADFEENVFKSLESTADQIAAEETAMYSSEEYLISLCISSKKLSEKLLSRSSTYLFIGSLIAFIGVIYFSVQSVGTIALNLSGFDLLVQFLPRLGALFFIEFVAFFFLKQYRITMDDFKHYETIKRQRESNLIILKLQNDLEADSKGEELSSYMEHFNLFNNLSVLKENETTESIQSKKYSNQELEILNNLINKLGSISKD